MDHSVSPGSSDARNALSHVSATVHDLLLQLAGTSDQSQRAALERMLARAERVAKALWQRVAGDDAVVPASSSATPTLF